MLVGIVVVILHLVGVVVGGQERVHKALVRAYQKCKKAYAVAQLLVRNLVGVTAHPLMTPMFFMGVGLIRLKMTVLVLRTGLSVRLPVLLGRGQAPQLRMPKNGKKKSIRTEKTHKRLRRWPCAGRT